MPPAPVKVFIASDMDLIKNSLRTLLENAPELSLEVVGTACNGEELMSIIPTLKADVLLLDNQLPDVKGVTLIKKINQENPVLKIVLMTLYKGFAFAINVIRLGAKGVLTKRADAKTLARIIAAVQNKGIIIYLKDDQPSICEKLIELLDKREMEVVCLMAKGLTGREIVKRLPLSGGTLDAVKQKLYDKVEKLEEFKDINRGGLASKIVYFVGVCGFCDQYIANDS